MTWQPIETAPTNVAVLVFVPDREHYGDGIYRAILVDMGTGRRWHSTGLAVGRDIDRDSPPTHWMPLPSPPTEPLLAYLTAEDAPTRDASWLRLYAAKVRDGTEQVWEIPSVRAATLEVIAARMLALQTELTP